MRSSVSLVIPFRNRETLLPRTLRSVAESSLFPAHIVLVDNGSADASLDVCRRWRAQHAGLRVTILRETAPGAAAARNKGLQAADTPWVFFFDSDDLLDRDFLADIEPHLTDELDFVAVPTRMDVDGKVSVRRYRPTDDAACQILYSHLNTQAMVFRTGFLRRIGAWDVRCMKWNDWELGIRVLLNKPRMRWLTSRPYHLISVHPDSITGNGYSDKTEDLFATLRIAGDDIRRITADSAERMRLHRALYLRYSILAGSLLAEGNKAGIRECLRQRRENFGDAAASLRFGGWIIERLTSLRLSGTWRLAMIFV